MTRAPARPAASAADSPGRTSPDHQKVAKRAGLLVKIRIGFAAEAAKPGGAPDRGLVELFPHCGRPHEGLVVEAGDEQRSSQLVDRAQIELQRGPAVLALGRKSVVKLDRGRLGVGLTPRAAAQFDQRVGLFRSQQRKSRAGDDI